MPTKIADAYVQIHGKGGNLKNEIEQSLGGA